MPSWCNFSLVCDKRSQFLQGRLVYMGGGGQNRPVPLGIFFTGSFKATR